MVIVDRWGSANCKEVSENGAPNVFIPTLGVILMQHHSEGTSLILDFFEDFNKVQTYS